MSKSTLGLCATVLLAGCAGITVTPLKPTGEAATSEAAGLRYYLPRPYLIVAELPPTISDSKSAVNNAPPIQNPPKPLPLPAPQNPAAPGNQFQPPSAPKPNEESDDKTTTSSPAPTSDMSFYATTAQYMIKLIYLPDLAHPMAITESTGLFGTSSMKPILQNGWMLTGLEANADSKVSETLTAVAGILSAVASGGASAAGGAAAKGGTKPPSGGPGTKVEPSDLSALFTPSKTILRPGLYRFDYDRGGNLTSLTPVAFFSGCGTTKEILSGSDRCPPTPTPPKPAAVKQP